MGTLTLNATSTYTGSTNVNGGTLAIGASNAISSGALNVNGGGTLDLGANSISVGLVTTAGASPVIAGSGTITSSAGFLLNHTGDTDIPSVLAGNVGLFKAQTNTVTLSGANTFTGPVEVQAGAIAVATMGNVGDLSSPLGAQADAFNAMIRLGSATTTGAIAYTGAGETSNRLIGLNGSTGGGTVNANGTGALILSAGAHAINGGAKALTLSGTASPTINNQMGLVEDYAGGPVTLAKAGTATWELTTVNTYTGATAVDEGTLRPLVDQNMTGALNFGTANTITTAGTLDLTNTNAAFSSLLVQTNSAVNTNQLIVGAGKTLTINGNATIGGNGANSTTLFTATGGGAMVVANPAASGVFAVGGNVGTGNQAIADLSGLSSLTIALDPATGVVRVNPNNATNVADKFSVLTLPSTGAGTTTITANVLAVGDSAQNGNGLANQLKLGSGVNTLNVNTINIGTGARDVGSLTFNGSTGSVIVRAADGTSRAAINVATGAASTGVTAGAGNVVDFSGHNADLLVSTLTIGGQNRNTDRSDVVTFNNGTLDATAVIVGDNGSTANGTAGSNTWTSTLNIGGGTTVIGTGGLEIARGDTAVTGTDSIVGAVNISGGTVSIADSTGLGAAVRLANNSIATGLTTSGSLNITGGAVTVAGNVIKGASTGAGSATTTLDGGSLDMSGNSIGTGTANVTLVAASGTLKNLAELNGGGVLTKTTAGVLALEGLNTYTGGTTVSAGTLLANNATGSATGSGPVTVDATGTLGGNGSIIAGSGSSITVNGTLDAGLPAASSGSALALTVGGAGNLALNGTTLFQLFTNDAGLSGTEADRVVVNAPSWSNVVLGGSSILNITTGLTSTTFVAGDSWKIFDWTGVATGSAPVQGTNGFNSITAPTLDVGLDWDYSALFSAGTISVIVVPEPSRALLLMLGLLGICVRRRRK